MRRCKFVRAAVIVLAYVSICHAAPLCSSSSSCSTNNCVSDCGNWNCDNRCHPYGCGSARYGACSCRPGRYARLGGCCLSSQCTSCSSSSDECYGCAWGLHVVTGGLCCRSPLCRTCSSTGTCYTCEPSYFRTASGTCCLDPRCTTCSTTDGKCFGCVSPYKVDLGTGTCVTPTVPLTASLSVPLSSTDTVTASEATLSEAASATSTASVSLKLSTTETVSDATISEAVSTSTSPSASASTSTTVTRAPSVSASLDDSLSSSRLASGSATNEASYSTTAVASASETPLGTDSGTVAATTSRSESAVSATVTGLGSTSATREVSNTDASPSLSFSESPTATDGTTSPSESATKQCFWPALALSDPSLKYFTLCNVAPDSQVTVSIRMTDFRDDQSVAAHRVAVDGNATTDALASRGFLVRSPRLVPDRATNETQRPPSARDAVAVLEADVKCLLAHDDASENFVDAVTLQLTVRRETLSCVPPNDAQINMTIEPPAYLLPPAVREAMVVTATAVSATSLAVGVTSTALQQQRLEKMTALVECEFVADEPPSVFESPTQLEFGDEPNAVHRGTVTGNVAVWGLGWLLLFFAAGGIHFGHALRSGEDGPSLLRSLAAVHFPGFALLPSVLVLQPTATATATLIQAGSPADKALAVGGGVALAGLTGCVLAVSLVARRQLSFSQHKEALAVRKEASVCARALGWFVWWMLRSKGKWVQRTSDGAHSGDTMGAALRLLEQDDDDATSSVSPAAPEEKPRILKHAGHLFKEYHSGAPWMLAVESMASIGGGVILGVQPASRGDCQVAFWAFALVLVLVAVVHVWRRPMVSEAQGTHALAVACSTALVAASLAVSQHFEPGNAFSKASAWLGAVTAFVSTAWVAVDLVVTLYMLPWRQIIAALRRGLHRAKTCFKPMDSDAAGTPATPDHHATSSAAGVTTMFPLVVPELAAPMLMEESPTADDDFNRLPVAAAAAAPQHSSSHSRLDLDLLLASSSDDPTPSPSCCGSAKSPVSSRNDDDAVVTGARNAHSRALFEDLQLALNVRHHDLTADTSVVGGRPEDGDVLALPPCALQPRVDTAAARAFLDDLLDE